MTLEQAAAHRPGTIFTGSLIHHWPLRTVDQVLADRRKAADRLVAGATFQRVLAELETGPQEAR
jgi:hypothetical protein